MKAKIQQFFIGRNGFDDLSRFLNWVSIILIVLSIIFGGAGSVAFYTLALACIVYAYYRALSKKVYVRMAENNKFLTRRNSFRASVRGCKERFAQRKEYKFFMCPSCRTRLRVPRGKGKIIMTCKKCGNRFEGKC